MKKLLATVLAGVMVLSLAACGAKENTGNTTDNGKPVVSQTADANNNTENNVAQPNVNPVELVFFPATSSDAGAYATIKVAASVQLDDESAWLGLCPAGKDYITELEADDVDVVWFNAEYREEGDPYVFACDFSEVDDGTYALVVTSSDDENVGYVVIQLAMTKSGDSVSFDFSNAQLKERPNK